MAAISKYGLDDIYKQIKGEYRNIRDGAVAIVTEANAGPVSFSRITNYMENLKSSITTLQVKSTKFSPATLAKYAQQQEDVPTYDPIKEYNAVVTAANNVINHIAQAVPTNSAHSVVDAKVVEPIFNKLQTAELRNLLNILVATIDPY